MRKNFNNFSYDVNNDYGLNEINLNQYYKINDIDSVKCKCCGNEILYPHTKYGSVMRANFKTETKGKTLKLCYKCLLNKFPEIEQKNSTKLFNTFNSYTKYAFDFSEDEILKISSTMGITLENLILKYGDEIGTQKFKNYCDKQAYSNSLEYKQKKYGWTEEEFKDFNLSRSVTVENLVKKHGEEKGNQMFEDYVEKQKMTKSNEFLVNKFGQEKVNDINQRKMIGLKTSKLRCSKTSLACFDKLHEILHNDFGLFFNYGFDDEIFVNDYIGETRCKYHLDFANDDLKICVEFNGDFYHANPNKYKQDDIVSLGTKGKKASDIWLKDENRKKDLESLGWKVFVIWESDYKNKTKFNEITQDIKNFIKSKI